jgi:6-phosphogluconolactonase (cycloisomerase 2 family)
MVAFDKEGRIVTVDGGTDRLSVLSLGQNGLAAHERVELEAGCRPNQVAMHPAGGAAYVMHDEAIACHSYDPSTGKFSGEAQRLASAAATGPAAMALHPSGRFLYACERSGGVRSWSLGESGNIRRSLGVQVEQLGELSALHVTPDGSSMIALNRISGTVQQAQIDLTTGTVSAGRVLTRVDSPASLVVLYS